MGSIGADLGKILGDIEKEYGESIFIDTLPDIDLIPFSSPQLNDVLKGGIPRGMSTEIVGEEHSGKSTLVLDLIKNYQILEVGIAEAKREALREEIKTSKGKKKERLETELEEVAERVSIYLDIESTTNPQWMKKMGVDASKVIIYQPADIGIEGPLDNIIAMMATNSVGLVAIDSVGQMISTAENEASVGKGQYGGISIPLTRYYKKATPLYSKNKIAHIMVNQTRADMSGYNQLKRPGGKAHAFAQAMVLRLKPGGRYDEKYSSAAGTVDAVYARETIVNVVKNKVTGSDRQSTIFTIRPNFGIDVAYDAANLLLESGLISQASSWFTIYSPFTGEEIAKAQGMSKMVEYLLAEENAQYFEDVKKYLYNKSTEDNKKSD